MDYNEWKLKLIGVIVGDNRVDVELKINEINCVLCDDCEYPRMFKEGDSPEEVWADEVDSIVDAL
jgi:hypothetical protein